MLPTDSKLRWEYREISYPVALSIGREPKPSEISDYWYSQGLHFIVTQPIDFIQLLAKKFYLFWNRFEIPNNQSFYSFLEYSTVLKWLPVGFWAIGPLGILGAILSWRQQQARLIVSFIMLYCLIVIAFFVCDRFRLPILPFLCVFSARAVTQMWDDFRAKRFRPLAMALILLLAFGGFTNSNIYNFQTEIRKVDLFHLGNAALDQLRFVDAISYFDQSDREPGHLKDTYLNRGVAQWKLNRPQPALIDFGRELKYFPRSYEALTNLSHIFLLQGVNDSTLVYSMKAIEIKPFAAPAYVDLAMAYDNLGQEYKAESVLVQGKKKCGSDFLYGESVLAGIHLVQGKHDDAMREYRSVLSRIEMNEQPQYKPEFRFGNSGQFASDPDEFKAKIFYSLGHIFLLKELVDSAAYYFTAATNLLPTFSQAWIDLGSTLHELRKSDESKSAYKRGLEIDSKSVIGWYNLGMLLIERGETTQATLALKNATKLKPEFAPAQGALDSISVATYR